MVVKIKLLPVLLTASLHAVQGYSQSPEGKLLLTDKAPQKNIVVSYNQYDTGGNTSAAHDQEDIYKWSGPSAAGAEGWGISCRMACTGKGYPCNCLR